MQAQAGPGTPSFGRPVGAPATPMSNCYPPAGMLHVAHLLGLRMATRRSAVVHKWYIDLQVLTLAVHRGLNGRNVGMPCSRWATCGRVSGWTWCGATVSHPRG